MTVGQMMPEYTTGKKLVLLKVSRLDDFFTDIIIKNIQN